MSLSPQFFRPFDITYEVVTTGIRNHPKRGPHDDAWLETLITKFKFERDNWTKTEAGLGDYWKECERLRLSILHLTAAAYLHVAYDLPRVIADNWPGHDTWAKGPSQVDGTLCFFGLSSVFHESFRRTARRAAVT